MKRFLKTMVILLIAALIAVFGLSACVAGLASRNIAGTDGGNGLPADVIEACKAADPQCILVLGCAVWAGKRPSPMLQDRLDTAIELYQKGVAPKLLFSGDNGSVYYSEPDCMLNYALEQGVPAEDIYLDFAGFSTYDSIYRAKAVFCAERVIVVTQKDHLFRALNLAGSLGIDAKGVASNQQSYSGRYYRELREVLARDKDVFKGLLKPDPNFLGDPIPVDSDGTVTHVN